MAGAIYCIDASSLIKLRQDFPRTVFPAVWKRVEQLAAEGRLIAPDEVAREIKPDDELGPWAKQHKNMFRRIDQQQLNFAQEIEAEFPALAKPGKFGPAADPFLVALARIESQSAESLFGKAACVVLTEERGPQSIPGACRHYQIACANLIELFQREGWVFH
jgi:hypothetical protein